MVNSITKPKKTPKIRKLSQNDIGSIIELLEHKTPMKDIAPMFNISRQYVTRINQYYLEVKSRYQVAQVADMDVLKKGVEDRFLRDVVRLQESISDADIFRATLRDKILAIGVLYDKHRLATGQSTSNVATLARIVESMDHGRRYPGKTASPQADTATSSPVPIVPDPSKLAPITVPAQDVTINDAPPAGDPEALL